MKLQISAKTWRIKKKLRRFSLIIYYTFPIYISGLEFLLYLLFFFFEAVIWKYLWLPQMISLSQVIRMLVETCANLINLSKKKISIIIFMRFPSLFLSFFTSDQFLTSRILWFITQNHGNCVAGTSQTLFL